MFCINGGKQRGEHMKLANKGWCLISYEQENVIDCMTGMPE